MAVRFSSDQEAVAPGDYEVIIRSKGLDRRIYYHVPASYVPRKEMPLIMAYHGYTDNAKDLRRMTHFDELSETENFIVAFMDGINMSWNGGVCCGFARLSQIDDVQFTRDALKLLDDSFCVDARRIYAAGFSNGGFLAHRLACEMSDTFAAVGAASAQMGGYNCNPTRPMPIISAHGTADPIVFLAGNPVMNYPSTDDVLKSWADRNGCQLEPEVFEIPGNTQFKNWAGCRDGVEVQLYIVRGGSHDWFGNRDWGEPGKFKNSPVFWEFFKRHPMP